MSKIYVGLYLLINKLNADIIGYMTLSNDSIKLSDAEKEIHGLDSIPFRSVPAILISEKAGNIVVIEEVDNGIHPSRATTLIKYIAQLANERGIDVIITTHNPALLNAVKGDNLYGVSVCYRCKEDRSSKIISFIDIDKYPSLLAQGGLGDLATSGMITKVLREEKRQSSDYSWMGV